MGSVEVKTRQGIGHVTGVVTCGSIHACPVCSARIREERAREVEAGLKAHIEAGGGALFVTFTAPHDAGDRLTPLWVAIMKGLAGVWGGRAWMADKERYGITGLIRALEVTHGESGWHPHVHALILTDYPLTPMERVTLDLRFADRWARAIVRAGLRSPSFERGVTVYRLTSIEAVAHYAVKISDEFGYERTVGRELTRLDQKSGRWHSRSPFQILADLVRHGDADDLRLWHEWEAASFGRRAVVWSPGLKASLGLDEARTDEDIVAEEIGGITVAVLATDQWRTIVEAGLEWELVAAAPEGLAAVDAVLALAGTLREIGFRAAFAGRTGWRSTA